MPNPRKIAAKSKTKASKYSKLMKAASKELADKKKALAKAEKTLATATKNHQDLLQETARLDMLERSLKALVDGTEPPQNIRYVYSYPQWVWYGNPSGWYWNGNSYTTTLGSQTQCYNSYQTGYQTPVTYTTAGIGTTTIGNTLSSTGTNSINLCTTNAGIANLTNFSNAALPSSVSYASSGDTNTITVDLSTYANSDESAPAVTVDPGNEVAGASSGN